VVVELTSPTIGFSETFFPVRGRPPSDPCSKIMCVGLIPNHFVEVKLKLGCPIPPTSKEWKIHRAPEAESGEDAFLDQMAEFHELIENEKTLLPKTKTNKDDPIYID
jgi:hypothetical protein